MHIPWSSMPLGVGGVGEVGSGRGLVFNLT